jgi:uncharacterized protein (TIGR02001 family)
VCGGAEIPVLRRLPQQARVAKQCSLQVPAPATDDGTEAANADLKLCPLSRPQERKTMKKLLLATSALMALTSVPSVALADVAFNVGAFTDYRYRGISQTRLKPAVQAGVDYSNSGFYLGAWASSIKWIKDAKGDSNIELDLYGGYKGELAKDLGYDVGVLTYVYSGNKLSPSANTTEIYGALTFGPVTAKYSHSTTNLFGFARSSGSGYLDLSATFEVADGWSVAPHLGVQSVRRNSNFSYTDYSLTLSKDFSGVVVSAALVATSTDKIAGVPAYSSPSGKNLGRTGLVLGLKYNF